MKLSNVHSVTELGDWFQRRGLSPGENFAFGIVSPVHVGCPAEPPVDWRSVHYHKGSLASLGPKRLVRGIETPQGNCAIDLNDDSVADDKFHRLIRGQWRIWKPSNETESLLFIYGRILAAAQKHHWPLYEMFFDGHGFMQSYGYSVNHPITGHDTHLHVGFARHSW